MKKIFFITLLFLFFINFPLFAADTKIFGEVPTQITEFHEFTDSTQFNTTVVFLGPIIDSSSVTHYGIHTFNDTTFFNAPVIDSSSLRVIGTFRADSTISSGATQWNSGNNIDADVIALTDTTLNDSDTTKHGWMPKLDADTTHFINGLGAWAVPIGTAPHVAVSPLDITNDTISISLSDSTTNGYLDSTNWQRFDSAYLYRFLSASGTLPLTLTLSNNVLSGSIAQSSATVNGYLDSTDWSTFNGKENVITFLSPLSRTNDTVSIPIASSTDNGYLDSTSKLEYDSAYLYRFLSASGTSPLTLTLSANNLSGVMTAVDDTTNGYLDSTHYTTWNAKQDALTFSTGLTETNDTITVNTSQNIVTLSNLTTNGFIITSGGAGTLGIDTAVYLTGNQTITLSGDATGSGDTAITVAVVDNSHNHDSTSISNLLVGDFASQNISQWTNDEGYITAFYDTNAVWGNITGTLSNQTDLQTELDGKSDTSHLHSYYQSTLVVTSPLSNTNDTVSISQSSDTTNGYLDSTDWSTFNAKQPLVVFSTGLTDTNDTVTVNTSQNITTLSNLTTNGFVKTSGGDGTLGIDTAVYMDTATVQAALDARCLESVFGTAIGTGLTLDATTLKTHTALQSIAGLTETNGGLPYGTADNAYAWLAAGAEGTLLMGNGAGAPSFLGAGTAGYVLLANGAADPVWTIPTGTGAPVKAGSPTVTGLLTVTGATSDTTAAALNVTNSGDTSLVYVRNDGNVGIGTTAPTMFLHIVGDGYALPATSGATQSAGKILCLEDSVGRTLDFGGNAGFNFWIQATFVNDKAVTTALLLNPNGGNVIIGDTTGAAKLTVNGGCNIGGSSDPGDNNLYVTDTCSALVFTDRTPFFEGDAIAEIKKVKGKNGELDHSKLPSFMRADIVLKTKKRLEGINCTCGVVEGEGECECGYEIIEEIVEGRNLGNSISVLIKAVQQQQATIEDLERRIAILE